MRRFHRSWREQKARRDERWIVLLWLIEALVLRRRALFLWRPTMAVSFDAAAAGGVSPSVTNLTINITIGSSANRAILVMVATDSAAGTTTVTNGTDTFSAISGPMLRRGRFTSSPSARSRASLGRRPSRSRRRTPGIRSRLAC